MRHVIQRAIYTYLVRCSGVAHERAWEERLTRCITHMEIAYERLSISGRELAVLRLKVHRD